MMKNRRCKTVLTLVAAALFALSASAGATPIPIDNPGFEDPALANGDWNYSMDNEGWGYVENDGYQGQWNVRERHYSDEAPGGENVGWTDPGGGFAQVLTDPGAKLSAGMTYTLSVEVGNAFNYIWGGYKVQLLAGGTPHTLGTGGSYTGEVTGGWLLAEDNNSLTPPAAGTFENSSVSYTYDPALHAGLLGLSLQIRLLALGPEGVDFDNASLDASPLNAGTLNAVPTPEPATMLLLGSGLVGLACFRRKYKK